MKITSTKQKFLGLLFALVMLFVMSPQVYAATTSTVSKTATSPITVYVPAGSYAWSNTVSIKFTSPNANATAIKVELPLSAHNGNPVVIQFARVTAPSGYYYDIPIGSGNSGQITLPVSEPIVGTWTVQVYCYSPTGLTSYGYSKYYPVKLTLTY